MKNKIEKSIKEAKRIMKDVPDSFHGGLEHARKVSEISKEILEHEPEADKDIVILAAWWHDTGRIKENEGHEKISAKMASDYHIKNGFDEDFCRKLYLAIAHHRFDEKPTNLEGQIIRDADKLALFDIKRWELAIDDEDYNKFEHTIHILPKVENEILERSYSHIIYKRVLKEFIRYIKNIDVERFENKKHEILEVLKK